MVPMHPIDTVPMHPHRHVALVPRYSYSPSLSMVPVHPIDTSPLGFVLLCYAYSRPLSLIHI